MVNVPDGLADVADYYAGKLAAHGASAQGVDWNGEQSQTLRFAQLARVIGEAEGFSINDLGCGYGALLPYLGAHFGRFRYVGYDVAQPMVASASERWRDVPGARFVHTSAPTDTADYTIASGIFNVKLQREAAQWRAQIGTTLDRIHETSSRGFAFNCLTSYSDADRMRDYLYYADPCEWFDWCKRRYARNVALLHDYGLYEFTLIVRKQA